MPWVQLFLVALGLSMDAFAVALGAGASGRVPGVRAAFRISFHFGLFQFLMPVAGWMLAVSLRPLLEAVDHWVAFALLWMVGLHMVHDGFGRGGGTKPPADPSRGVPLIALSVATSIDALAVGVSLAFLGELILWQSVAIGAVTGTLSLLGVRMGARLGARFGERMEIVGGLILLGIGVQIVLSHV
jgi:putative Mn2+ efflux pump MntP